MNFFPGQEKTQGILWLVREILKGLRKSGKVRDFENKWLL